ncbi:hypothetical protein HDU79_011118 [Rhizoclosmatium sp. JEL0117]|nr:hypothetical protein HDU79_011118 [Rhizoclosmatium sp. JEL0117]
MNEMDFDQDLDPISELLELCRGFYIERKAIVDADEDYLAEQLEVNAIRMADQIANVNVQNAIATEAANDTARADAENEEESPMPTVTPAIVELQDLPDIQLLTRFEQLISIGNESEVRQMLRLILKAAQDNGFVK